MAASNASHPAWSINRVITSRCCKFPISCARIPASSPLVSRYTIIPVVITMRLPGNAKALTIAWRKIRTRGLCSSGAALERRDVSASMAVSPSPRGQGLASRTDSKFRAAGSPETSLPGFGNNACEGRRQTRQAEIAERDQQDRSPDPSADDRQSPPVGFEQSVELRAALRKHRKQRGGFEHQARVGRVDRTEDRLVPGAFDRAPSDRRIRPPPDLAIGTCQIERAFREFE